MRLIYITFFICGLSLAQQLELEINDSTNYNKRDVKIDSNSKIDFLDYNLDTIVNKDNILPGFKIKSKEDIEKRDSILINSKKRRINRYRKIKMDTILIKNYKIYNYKGAIKNVDSSLNINKEYKFNYLRKDYFELLPFPNVGQGFNRMGYDFTKEKINPQLGARGRNYGYLEMEDIHYYEVPTPLTELFFKTTYDQGQLLDALISVNTSPNLNITVAHKGLRSLGNYINSKTNATNLRFSAQYKNYNERYQLRSHIVAQKLTTQENGGIDSLSVYFFEKATDELEYDGFLDRARLVTNVEAQNVIQGKRYFISQSYKLLPSIKDSLKYNLNVGYDLTYETKNHFFSQNKSNNFLGENLITTSSGDFVSEIINDVHKLRSFDQKLYVKYNLGLIGLIDFGLKFNNWNYFKENNLLDEDAFQNIQSLKINQQTLIAAWDKSIFGYNLKLNLQKSFKEEFGNSLVDFNLYKLFDNLITLNASLSYRTESPNFNFYLFRSSYEDYNWYKDDWLLQKSSSIIAEIGHPKWGALSLKYEGIDDYLFFKDVTPSDQINKMIKVSPTQSKNRINYLKTRFFQHLKLWKLGLINTIQYQKVNTVSNETNFNALNVPKWITRSTLMLETFLFKKALFIQAGGTFQYFSKYYADQYHPILGEFASQNHTEIGNFPRIDFFLNAKIQNTRLFLKYEHINSDRTGYNYFSAPFVPYRDGSIRFGLVWNMFQ